MLSGRPAWREFQVLNTPGRKLFPSGDSVLVLMLLELLGEALGYALGAGLVLVVMVPCWVGDWQTVWSSSLTPGPSEATHFLPGRAMWG